MRYSTCLEVGNGVSGKDNSGLGPTSIAVDSRGKVFLAGGAYAGFPTTANAYQASYPGGPSAFVALLDITMSGPASLLYSTYLGQTNPNQLSIAQGIAVDSFGKIYITGKSQDGFPITAGAFQTVHGLPLPGDISPNFDAFVRCRNHEVYN